MGWEVADDGNRLRTWIGPPATNRVRDPDDWASEWAGLVPASGFPGAGILFLLDPKERQALLMSLLALDGTRLPRP